MQTMDLKRQMGKLHEEMPGVMKEGFDLLSEQVLKEGALSKKNKRTYNCCFRHCSTL